MVEDINPFTFNGFFYHTSLAQSISNSRVSWLLLIITMFIEISACNANSADSDQMMQNVAHDLGLHCLSITLFTRLKWAKEIKVLIRVVRTGFRFCWLQFKTGLFSTNPKTNTSSLSSP